MTDAQCPEPNGAVHPVAALFPLLGDEELAALAEDIQAHGQRLPILLDGEGTLIDGRNREAACRLAGVAPQYARWAGEDPAAFILSLNVERRHLTKGQQAVAIAQAEILTGVKFRHGEASRVAADADLDATDLSRARTVARCAPALVAVVLAGGSLKDAYAHALAVKRAQADAEAAEKQRLRTEARALKRLKVEQPDLAAEVTGGRLTVAQALAAEERRIALRRLEESFALTAEAIGPEVPLPPPLEAAPVLDPVDLPPAVGGWVDIDPQAVDRESVYARRLLAIKRALGELAAEPLPERSGFTRDGNLGIVRSWASQVVTLAYGILEAHEAQAEGRAVRLVQ